MTGQTLIFGVGAAKSGTSWLHDALARHEASHFPQVKELHYWDSLDLGHGRFWRRQIERQRDILRRRRAGETRPAFAARQEAAIADLTRWLEVFDGKTANDAAYLEFLGRDRPGAQVIGDITPSYALLSARTYRAMAGLTARVRFIYLMRDPVARVWSQIRMDSRKPDLSPDRQAANAKMDAWLEGREHEIDRRSDYRATLNRLIGAVGRDRVHVEFYERLFSGAAIARIARFLGISPWRPRFDKRVNASAPLSLDEARQEAAARRLRAQYEYVSGLTGDLPEQWANRMVRA